MDLNDRGHQIAPVLLRDQKGNTYTSYSAEARRVQPLYVRMAGDGNDDHAETDLH